MKTVDELLKNNRVGPVMRAGEVAEAVKEAAALDNPGKEILAEESRQQSRCSRMRAR